MSLLGRSPRPVYRVYAEEECFDEETESVGAAAQSEPVGTGGQAEPAGVDPSPTGIEPGHRRSAVERGGFESRLRLVALFVAGLIVAVVAVAAVLVVSAVSRHPRRRATAASAPLATLAHRHLPAAPATSMRPRSVSNRVRRASSSTRAHRGSHARLSAVAPIPIALGGPVPSVSVASVLGEFGFER